MISLLHKNLCDRAVRWLKSNRKCSIAFCGVTPMHGETPDAWGIRGGKESHLVEVKTSRSDFTADKKKRFRSLPECGMGNYRWYLCPAGVIEKEEVPEGWGLLYWTETNKVAIIKHPSNMYCSNRVAFNERPLMFTLLSRAVAHGVFDEITKPYRNRLTNSTEGTKHAKTKGQEERRIRRQCARCVRV